MLTARDTMFGDSDESDDEYTFPIQEEYSQFELEHVHTDTWFELFVDKDGEIWITDESGESHQDEPDLMVTGEIQRMFDLMVTGEIQRMLEKR